MSVYRPAISQHGKRNEMSKHRT